MRECWAKNHDLREEKWHFLKISNCYCVFELNPSKDKETVKTVHFLSCDDIKMKIMTSYFRIRDKVIKISLNFTRFLPIVYFC